MSLGHRAYTVSRGRLSAVSSVITKAFREAHGDADRLNADGKATGETPAS